MDILMLYHRLPYPPNKGDKIRAYHQVRYLASRHRVWLACFVDDAEDYPYLPELQKICHRFEAIPLNRHLAFSRGGLNLLCGKTVTEGYYGHPAMWRVIQAWSENKFFDVAFCFSSSMAVYVEDLPVGRRVLDMNDFDSHKWSRYSSQSGWPLSAMFRTEASRLASRELELLRKFDLTLLVNERECERVQDAALRQKILACSTPMDAGQYESIWGIHQDQIIGYVGTLSYRPNIEAVLWFAQEVWPSVKQEHPQAEWWIVGRQPVQEIRRLAQDSQIRVVGDVDRLDQYFARMRVFIAPAQNDIGVQTKVLEAMSAGRAVVISGWGHRGIGATCDHDYVVAETPRDFSAAVGGLLDHHERCVRLGEQAVAFIREKYDVTILMPQFEKMLLGSADVQRVSI